MNSYKIIQTVNGIEIAARGDTLRLRGRGKTYFYMFNDVRRALKDFYSRTMPQVIEIRT